MVPILPVGAIEPLFLRLARGQRGGDAQARGDAQKRIAEWLTR